MKRFTRCLCLFLVVVVCLTTTAFAAETAEPRSSMFFAASCTYLEKISDTKFEVWFDITAVAGMEELGASVIKVQRSSDGENWTTMKTYTKEDYPELICENTCWHVGCVTYTGTQGYYYRAKVTYYAKNSSGFGELNKYSDTIHL